MLRYLTRMLRYRVPRYPYGMLRYRYRYRYPCRMLRYRLLAAASVSA